MPAHQTIPASLTGTEYTWPLTITEDTGKDISGCTITLALGTATTPGDWQTPDTDPAQDNKAQRVVQLLIPDTEPPADYYLWSKVVDGAETVIRRQAKISVT